jgi:predicted acylesterase/phospholipase RssA
VLLVGAASAASQPGEAESVALDHGEVELAIVHGDGSGDATSPWLVGRSVRAWHHIGDSKADLDRLARRLAGQATGLVLGGGGARGFAHLGVLRALQQTGVEVDAVGGSSIGGVMAAFLAMGWDDATRVRKAMAAFVETRRLIGLTLPVVSLSSARRLTRLLQDDDNFGAASIEDLHLPFFSVSARMSDGAAVVHDRGPLWWALRATVSIPGVLPPVFDNGDLLVDGGALNMLPVDVMRSRMDGRVIAVELRGQAPTRRPTPFDPAISGWTALSRRLRPHGSPLRLPGPAATVLRAKDLAGKQAHRERVAAADVLLRPPIDGVDTLDFRAAPPLIDAAYRYTVEALEAGALVGG